MTAKGTPICTTILAYEGKSYLGQIRIDVAKVGERFVVSMPPIPGVDEYGFIKRCDTIEQAREAYRAYRRMFPLYLPMTA
jgi:hypothetical protein